MKIGKAHASLTQFVEVWGLNLASVTPNIRPAQIIGADENNVWEPGGSLRLVA